MAMNNTKSQNVLTIQSLSVAKPGSAKTQNLHYLVKDVNCELAAGEVLAIIGPNGAGKSTLLKAISGDLNFTGKLITPALENENKLRARQLAVLPQFSLLNFPYRVHEVVALGRIPHATGAARDQQIINQALELMDIAYLTDRLYPDLSGGEKQRVQLARVLAQIWHQDDAPNQTRLLLLDEPTTALDLGHQQDLMRVIKSFAERGVAVVMVLHDINLAAQYANKLLALLCSETLAYGSLDEVIQKPIIDKLFSIDSKIIKHPNTGKLLVIGS